MKDQASTFPHCLPLCLSTGPLPPSFHSPLFASPSFSLSLFLSLPFFRGPAGRGSYQQHCCPSSRGLCKDFSLFSLVHRLLWSISVPCSLFLPLSIHWVNTRSDALCEPGRTPPCPPCLYVSTVSFPLGRKDLMLRDPLQHLYRLTSPCRAPSPLSDVLLLKHQISPMCLWPHTLLVPLSTRGAMSNDHNVQGLAQHQAAQRWCHICSLFTPEDLEPALRRAELKPHVTPCAACGGVWLRARQSPPQKNTQLGGGHGLGHARSWGRLHPVYIACLGLSMYCCPA